jgi:hypothetical protein
MGGLRVTLARKHPLIFDMHPIPWRFGIATDGKAAVIDGVERSILHPLDAGVVAHWLYDLYRYVVPAAMQSPSNTYVPLPAFRMPTLLVRHPLPWKFMTLRHSPTSEQIHSEWTYELLDADGDHVVTWHRLDIIGAMHDLSRLAEDKYMAQIAERGLGGQNII